MKVYEFEDHKQFQSAAIASYKKGNLIDVYSFLPEDELIEELKQKSLFVPFAAIGGALFGAIGGFLLQYLPNIYHYQMNISGKPLNSWPAFLLITFEMGVLFSAFSILGSFILGNKLPRFDREIYSLAAYNERRHDHYFIVTKKEDQDVEALASYDLSPFP